MRELIPYFAIIISALSLMVAAVTFWRNGNWRQTDEGQKLIGRIAAVERKPDWNLTESGRHIVDQVAEIREQLAAGEARFENFATKTDIASIKAELHGLEKTVNAKIDGVNNAVSSVGAGVDRIEGYFLQKGIS